MSLRITRQAYLGAAALLWCAAFAGGCASWQGPRIDPSGEQLLIWPNQAPSAVAPAPTFAPAPVAAPPGAPIISAPPAATVISQPPPVAAPVGNVQAPPVFSDPAPATAPATNWNPFAPAPAPPAVAPPVVAPSLPMSSTVPAPMAASALPPPPVAPAPVTTVAALPLSEEPPVPQGVPFLRLTPAGIIMPVCSEVVLKASICGGHGYVVSNERVEWTLDRGGAGQIGDLSTARQVGLFYWPFDIPQRYDNWTAVGNTARVQTTLKRATPDPADDVVIDAGDAWLTVTSATEGTSVVTAYAPGLPNYNRVTATIYWVDAQWLMPPSAVVACGRPHVLTTTVTRRDGAPQVGWLVRYNVSSGASLGYEGGNTVEVPTDSSGRASVEVSPANMGGGATNVGVTIIRPPVSGPVPTPRLEIGRGSATITWSGSAPPSAAPAFATPIPSAAPMTTAPGTFTSPTLPPPPVSGPPGAMPAPSLPSGPIPSNTTPFATSPPPSTTTPPSTASPPPPSQPAGKPELQIQLRRSTPEQVGVGEFASFEVLITNRGTGTARGILVQDRFDRGLRHPEDRRNEFAVKYSGVRDLPPGESATVPLTFQVVAAGMQCHEVTVTAEGAQPVKERGCISATAAALDVSVTGPRSRVVGETAPFEIAVKNNGTVAASNIELVIRLDAALNPTDIKATHKRLPDGGILVNIDRLLAGERRPIEMWAQCVAPSNSACTQAVITADGGITAAADACVEVLPPATPRP